MNKISINDMWDIHSVTFILKEKELFGRKLFYMSCESSNPNDMYNDVESDFFKKIEECLDLNIAFEDLYEEYKFDYYNIDHFKNAYHHIYSLCSDSGFIETLSSIFRNKKIDDILN